jgi:hypothetical protein
LRNTGGGGTIEKAQKEMCYVILLRAVGSTLCVVIPISMCYNFMYRILIFYVFFLKFIVNTTNFEIVKSGILMLTEREKTDMTDTDVVIN